MIKKNIICYFKIKGGVHDCWFNARGGGRGQSFHFTRPPSMFNPPLFWPIFSESGIVFCVYDLVWPPIIGQSFLTSIFWPQKLKNWKSTEYRHVAYQMKAKDSRITMKICPDKWEVKWLTSGWPALNSDDLSWFSIFQFLRSLNGGLKLWPMMGGQTRSWTRKTMLDSENMGQNRG